MSRSIISWSIGIFCLSFIGCAPTKPDKPPSRTGAQNAVLAYQAAKSAAAAAPVPLKPTDGTTTAAALTTSTAQVTSSLPKDQCQQFESNFSPEEGASPAEIQVARFNLGVVLQDCGQTDRAVQIYQALIQGDRSFLPPLINLGGIKQARGELDQAGALFKQASEAALRPGQREDTVAKFRTMAFYGLAAVAYLKHQQSPATAIPNTILSDVRRSLALDPHYAPAYVLMAAVYHETARGERSKLDLPEFICGQGLAQLQPRSATAPVWKASLLNMRGVIRLGQQRVGLAIQDFQEAVQSNPALVPAWLNLGSVLLDTRAYQKAEAAFRGALAVDPRNIDGITGLGVALRGQKQLDAAEQQYNLALQISPTACAPLYNLGLLYQDHKTLPGDKQWETATGYYERFRTCPGAPANLVADATTRLGDIQELRKASSPAPQPK